MIQFFNIFGSLFGYLLWAAYYLINNFGIAIIIFTLIFKIVLFPSSVKQQKSMAANAKLQAKQKALQEKYSNDKQKYNEELQKLYEKENVKPFGGCLTSLLPMFVMLGIYYSVVRPLSNVLHIATDKVTALSEYINTLPGVSLNSSSLYSEIELIRIFDKISTQEAVTEILTGDEIEKISLLSGGFNFFGLDLLSTPKFAGGWILIIPILCLVTSVGSQVFMMFMKGNPMSQQQGCMKYMFIALPVLTAWIAYTVPAAVGFYWICSTVFGFVQTLIMNKFYSPDLMNAKMEAQHIARLELEEKNAQYNR
ncbi:MAG: YidC/Oxa1 family membrane protein insertase [Ruminococcaceae bacterium]|nr:YidC/Oxa1 family membrane protein insertase [Oscillospiraceae bacterium]